MKEESRFSVESQKSYIISELQKVRDYIKEAGLPEQVLVEVVSRPIEEMAELQEECDAYKEELQEQKLAMQGFVSLEAHTKEALRYWEQRAIFAEDCLADVMAEAKRRGLDLGKGGGGDGRG